MWQPSQNYKNVRMWQPPQLSRIYKHAATPIIVTTIIMWLQNHHKTVRMLPPQVLSTQNVAVPTIM